MKNYLASTNGMHLRFLSGEFMMGLRNILQNKPNINERLGLYFQGNHLESKFRLMQKTLTLENWQRQMLSFLFDVRKRSNNTDNRLMKAYAGRIIEKVYNVYTLSGKSPDQFYTAILAFAESSPDIYHFFNDAQDTINLPRKRQPSLIESIHATLERLKFLEVLPHIFNEDVQCILVGGSIAYGPFLNVRSGHSTSDIDMIIVAEDNFFQSKVDLEKFEEIGISFLEAKKLEERKKHFRELQRTGDADILSQRFTIKGHDFTVSIHFFPVAVFEDVYSNKLGKDLSTKLDTVVTVKDYKDKKYDFPDCNRWNFSGDECSYVLPPQINVAGGIVAQLPSSIIYKGRFFPGFYHHIILPMCKVVYENNNYASNAMKNFNALISARISYEKGKWEGVSFLNSHPRHPIFAPGKYDHWLE